MKLDFFVILKKYLVGHIHSNLQFGEWCSMNKIKTQFINLLIDSRIKFVGLVRLVLVGFIEI